MIINLSVENYKVKDRVVLNNFKLNIDKFNFYLKVLILKTALYS